MLEAIVLYSIIFGASSVIGPAFFGPLVSTLGIASIFIVIGVTYVVTVITLFMMKQLKVRESQAIGQRGKTFWPGFHMSDITASFLDYSFYQRVAGFSVIRLQRFFQHL